MGTAFYYLDTLSLFADDGAGGGFGSTTYLFAHNEDYSVQALELFIYQYTEKPRLNALMSIYVSQLQELEDAIWDLALARWVEDAEGEYLVQIAKLVGQEENGLSTEDLRAFTRARIVALRAGGYTEDFLEVMSLLLTDEATTITLIEEYPMAVRILVYGAGLGDMHPPTLFQFLRMAKQKGVALRLEYSDSPDDETFTFADTPTSGSETIDADLGFSDTDDPTTGGHFATVLGV